MFLENIQRTFENFDDKKTLSNKFNCPICFQYYTEKEFDTHVNNCFKVTQESNPSFYDDIDKNMTISSKRTYIEENNLNKISKINTISTNTLKKYDTKRSITKVFKNQKLHLKKRTLNKICQFYKIMPHTGFSVDAFEFGKIEGCIGYFLSHFHSDHYKGLTRHWNNGLIYCSEITGNLVISQLKVKPEYVVKLPMDRKILLNNIWVTLVDANHCPGSVLFIFEFEKSGKSMRYLHCGDFRACPSQISHSAIKNKHFDFLYLDTTYFNPKYLFPSQETVINAAIEICKILNNNFINNDFPEKRKSLNLDNFLVSTNITHKNQHRLLILINTYIIGKEKLALGIANSLKSKIYANQYKQKIISCLENEKLSSLLTSDPSEASVHLVNFKNMSVETLNRYLIEQKPHFSKIVGFNATGRTSVFLKSRFIDFSNIHSTIKDWKISYNYTMIKSNKDSTNTSICYSIPYSEHSSFKELICFCLSIDVDKIFPTVNIHTQKSRDSMEKWINLLENEKKKNGLLSLPSDQIW
ncbi:hypothetical protein PNEG_02837 [Pneumocystis murina B123]|uniref:DNA repair metallo-beta-lactamase domain-containing protein n=1 Tax=Pneumocystis murina (strain B123) TaxID=1069680 RepID=M7NP79_PNEMU|nr:hypothetical protein PNEG_02837 [Pneumocystis murina B123]EMR09067.1 hypothetical protein PNEG_02837 [Pneumocystis murina B123]